LAREAEHLWAAGRHDQVVECLEKRQFPIPADNLRRWRSWAERLRSVYGTDHPDTLSSVERLAEIYRWIGKFPEAVAYMEGVVEAYERLFGALHIFDRLHIYAGGRTFIRGPPHVTN